MRVMTRKLLQEQIAVVVVLERGVKNGAMFNVPHHNYLISNITYNG